jgi:hypothetical protein
MQQVFLSSVSRGLEPYREVAYQVINGLDGYHCVRMEDFGARDWESDDFCRARVAECDLFIGIVGLLYGSCPPGSSISYTEREYDAAVESGKHRLMCLAPPEFPLAGELRESDEKHHKQEAFRARVKVDRQVDFFANPDQLGTKVVQGIHNLAAQSWSALNNTKVKTRLLFPFVSSREGFDTGLTISNISAMPGEDRGTSGACAIHYYGDCGDGSSAPSPQFSRAVAAGEVLIWTLFAGGITDYLLKPTPTFQGYIIVECSFPARGFAMLSDLGANKVATGYLAEILS